MKRFQIIHKTIVCGKECECLCTAETASGEGCICHGEENAKKRVAELIEAGYDARYEELPWGTAWFDDENWIG